MSAKTYWNLLVLFGVLCQGIIGAFAEKDIDVSSELLVRQKRVINRAEGGDVREQIKNAPYVVSVKKLLRQEYCVGAILSKYIVITVAKCVAFNLEFYSVYSGSAGRPNTPNINHFVKHRVTNKKEKLNYHPNRPGEGIALITVTPSFTYSINTQSIQLNDGHNQHGLYGIVSGWGCDDKRDPGTSHANYLRSIMVPIINNRECARLYHNIFKILDTDVCIFDPTGNQYCGINDTGAPLVIIDANNRKKLVGVHLWNGAVVGRANPDVFANVQHPLFRDWIAEASINLTRIITHDPSSHSNLQHPHN